MIRVSLTVFFCGFYSLAKTLAGGITPEPAPACYTINRDIQIQAHGRDVPVIEHRVQDRLNALYAWLDSSGPIEITVRKTGGIKRWNVSPVSYKIQAKVEGDALKFTLPAPRYLVLTLDGVRILLLVDLRQTDAPTPEGPGVINVSASPFLADASGQKNATVAIQQAFDAAAAEAVRTGKATTVFIPAGIYEVTSLQLRSQVHVYLDAGAVLRGIPRAEEHPAYPRSEKQTGYAILLHAKGVDGVRIFGRGTLDAARLRLRRQRDPDRAGEAQGAPLTVEDSRHVTIEGILCREATSWTVPVFNSQHVTVRRVKVINDLGPLKHSDGINLCTVRQGLVEDCFVHTTDDAFCAKATEGGPCEDLVFRRLVALSNTRGLKCGHQAYEALRRVRFENVDVVETRDGFDLYHKDGTGLWEDITFRDIRVERCSRYAFSMSIEEGGSIRGVRIERASFAERRPVRLRGLNPMSRIENVLIQGLSMSGTPVREAKAMEIRKNQFTDDVQFE